MRTLGRLASSDACTHSKGTWNPCSSSFPVRARPSASAATNVLASRHATASPGTHGGPRGMTRSAAFFGTLLMKLTGSQRGVASWDTCGSRPLSAQRAQLNWAAPAAGMLFSQLKGEVFLHGQGSYM